MGSWQSAEAADREAVVLATSSIRQETLLGGNAKTDVRISRLSAVFAVERNRGVPTLCVDGGNFLRGSKNEFGARTFSAADYMCEIMECVGYDALTPGVGELAIGRSALFDLLTRHATLRMVSANVRDLEGRLVFPPYLLIKRTGLCSE